MKKKTKLNILTKNHKKTANHIKKVLKEIKRRKEVLKDFNKNNLPKILIIIGLLFLFVSIKFSNYRIKAKIPKN